MNTYEVTGIIWSTDDEDIELPTKVTIDAYDEDDAIERLSDEYGWLIESIEDIVAIN